MQIAEILALLTAVLWATAVMFFKISGDRVHPIALNLFKDVLAFLLFIPTMIVMGEDLFFKAPTGDLIQLIVSGLMGICLADTLYFYSLRILGAGVSSIVNCLYSPAVIFVSMITLGERLTFWQIFGVGAIVFAVGLATSRKSDETLSRRDVIKGLGAGIGAALTSAIGIVLMKPILMTTPLIWASEVRLLAGMVGLFVLMGLHPRRKEMVVSLFQKEGRFPLVMGAFIGAYLALIPWAAGFKHGSASTTSALQQTSYLIVFVLAVIFLKEKMTVWKAGGIALGMAGVYLVTFG